MSGYPALTCAGCGHGWHPQECPDYVAAGGVAVVCRCTTHHRLTDERSGS